MSVKAAVLAKFSLSEIVIFVNYRAITRDFLIFANSQCEIMSYLRFDIRFF